MEQGKLSSWNALESSAVSIPPSLVFKMVYYYPNGTEILQTFKDKTTA
jgi:hypothetical protein